MLSLLAADIKLAHSIFALPFALLAVFLVGTTPNTPLTAQSQPSLASPDATLNWPTLLTKLGLVVICMVAARTWAMLFNRLVDRGFDAENARTRRRVIAAGTVSVRAGWLAAIASILCFLAGCAGFLLLYSNPWPLYLSLPVLAWIAFYSLTKRFTFLCHLFLGGALAASPLAAAIAVDPTRLANTPALFGLAAFVLLWVAGFDIIYAIADQDFDRARGLFSIPARLGTTRALWVSRLLHALACIALFMAWRIDPRLGTLFAAAMAAVLCLLIVEHIAAAKGGKAGLNLAFFTLNGIVSCFLGLAGVIDVLT